MGFIAKNVSTVVSGIVGELYYLSAPLEVGLINHSALARMILPRVRRELGDTATFDAVLAAVRRYRSSKRKGQLKHFREVAHSAKCSVRTGLADVHFTYSPQTLDSLLALCKKIDWARGEKIILLPRANEVSVIVQLKYLPDVLACIPKQDLYGVFRNRALLTVSYDPVAFFDSYGGLNYMTGQFASLGVSILLMFCSWSQTSFLVQEEDVAFTYKSLQAALLKGA